MKLKEEWKEDYWWKWGFLLILSINIAFVGVVASRLIQVREPAVESGSSKKNG